MSVLCGTAGLTPQAESDWPRWRGPHYDGKSRETGIFHSSGIDLRIAWKVPLGTGYSAVSVAQGRAVTLFSDAGSDWVGALDAASGRELWRYRIDSAFPGRDGARDGPTATPLIDSGQVFAVGPRGQLLCLDLETGGLIWSADLRRDLQAEIPRWGFTTSPLVYNDLLIVTAGGTQGASICAFDRKTGRRIWASGRETVEYQSPILAQLGDSPQVVYAGNETLYGIDPTSGAELWKVSHQGAGFYRRIINPVAAGEGKLFLLLDRTNSTMIRIVRHDDRLQAEKLWTVTHFKRNYNVPIYHQGYLYGYSGEFLACIDADSGELAWKSRPPGNGFLSFADGHLVVMDRKGALHVAPASPQGYRETASLDLFGKESWTPPSIAGGRIYARSSFGEVAAVEIVPASMTAPARAIDADGRLIITQSSFHRFVQQVEASAEQDVLISEFMAKQQRFPILEGDRWVHIVYRGPANDLALGGDMFEARKRMPMNRIPGTDFWFASLELEPGSLLSYFFERDLEEQIADPLNAHQMMAPVVFGGVASQLLMSGRSLPDDLNPAPEGVRGRLEKRSLQDQGETAREISVYLPAGYDEGTENYPVLYVHYGDHALTVGKMDNLLDNLIAARRIRPLIAVFIPAATPYEFARSEINDYVRILIDELVPDIDRSYRTLAEAPFRALMGGDEGGFGAFYAAFKRPGVFGKAAAHSAIRIGYGDRDLFNLIRSSADHRLEAYLDWGRYDFRNPSTGEMAAAFSRELSRRLKDAGHQVKAAEYPDGAGFPAWRARTHLILEAFFPLP